LISNPKSFKLGSEISLFEDSHREIDMNRLALLAPIFLILGVGSLATGQQVADPNFDPKVARPAYTETHPKVLFDEAHANFHTTTGRYKPFADLIASDGLKVIPSKAKFSKEMLQAGNVLIIANAMSARQQNAPGFKNSAFTDDEADAVRDWVKDGGSLLLITDHDPFGSASESLAARFGVDMSKGITSDPAHFEKKGNPSWLHYTRDDKSIGDHPITRGRDDNERIKHVLTFAGQSLKGPSGSVAFLKLADTAFDQVPPGNKRVSAAGRAQGVAFPFGKGRVVMMGEAGMLSAQVYGPNREPMGMNFPGTDNRQLALNILHWLASPKPEPSKPEAEPRQVTLEGLITADPLPEGYAVVRQEIKDKAGKPAGDLLIVSKEGIVSKVIVTVDRLAKVGTKPGKVAATKGYVNGTAQSLVVGQKMKIVKKNIPDIAKANLDERFVVDLTLEKPGGGELMVQIQIFFEKAGYALQVIGDNKGEFETLVKWANSVKGAP
jgi:hypothetical protein